MTAIAEPEEPFLGHDDIVGLRHGKEQRAAIA
jgi:hypothetical protein